MATMLTTGQTGRAHFRDGAEGMTSAAAMALENHPVMHPDGPFERVQTLPPGYTYSVQQHDGATYLMRRSNEPNARTEDSERAILEGINARNRAFWTFPLARRGA